MARHIGTYSNPCSVAESVIMARSVLDLSAVGPVHATRNMGVLRSLWCFRKVGDSKLMSQLSTHHSYAAQTAHPSLNSP